MRTVDIHEAKATLSQLIEAAEGGEDVLMAGREMLFVVNHTVEDFDLDDRFHSLVSDVAAKISYTFRF
jgi:hypothetical protein